MDSSCLPDGDQNHAPRSQLPSRISRFGRRPRRCAADPPGGLSNWSFDELTLKNGAKFEGLILSEDAEGIRFQSVSRPPGRPTVTLTSFFTKAEIAESQAALRRRPRRPEGAARRTRPQRGGRAEADGVARTRRHRRGRPAAAKRYESDYFTLVSTGSDELVRRSAVRLEQIYTAFARFLPPTREGRPAHQDHARHRPERVQGTCSVRSAKPICSTRRSSIPQATASCAAPS